MEKKKRRGHGEGTLYQRKDGWWIGQVSIGRDTEGNPKRATVCGKTQGEVRDKITALRHEQMQGNRINPSKITLGEWLDTWLEHYAKPRVRQTTWEQYEYLARRHIKPALGKVQLRKLQGPDLQRLYNEKLKNGLSARTVRLMHVVLHSALGQAVKDGMVLRNVAQATAPPRVTKKEIKTLAEDQMGVFLDAAEGTRLYPAVLMLLGTGLRRGEMLGLKWQDIDFQEGILYVRRSLVKTNSGSKIQETKTGRERSVPVPTDVLRELKAHKARQAQEKLKLGEGYQDQGFVFATPLGTPTAPRNFYRYFRGLLFKMDATRLARETGKPMKEVMKELRKSGDGLLNDITIHSLRHTYATMLLKAGEHPKVVQEILGHASITMTIDTYSHVVPGLKHQAAATINDLLKRNTPTSKEG
ncbi:MAG: site-specific integrase [Firmicutes bacterium]|nr:site-specific integrase [Bacillota bacterium]MBV1727028.1 site-specific integrase [Desulforudis sp.]MBV1734538.1 site-specific integrase [Desulforudis sp.]MBV1769043.1 site-specific integrase [Desulforudis sp.]